VEKAYASANLSEKMPKFFGYFAESLWADYPIAAILGEMLSRSW
jgi:hypothetical protein